MIVYLSKRLCLFTKVKERVRVFNRGVLCVTVLENVLTFIEVECFCENY